MHLGTIEIYELASLNAALITKAPAFPEASLCLSRGRHGVPPNDGLVLFSLPLNLAVDASAKASGGPLAEMMLD
jgi:hypothetical protein